MLKQEKYCVDCGVKISFVSTRCRKCAKALMAKQHRESVTEKEVVALYQDGLQAKEIAAKFGKTTGWVDRVLKHHSIPRTHGKAVYYVNESALDEDTPEKYYLLGLIATDGCISRNRTAKYWSLSLASKDVVLLNDIRKFLRTSKPLYADKEMRSLVVYSSKMAAQLEAYGITERKTYNLKLLKKIPTKYVINFLHGCFDGDGSITKPKGRSTADVLLCMTVSREFAQQIVGLYKRVGFNVRLYTSKPKDRATQYLIKSSGRPGLKILREFYSNRSLFLPRKYEIYLTHVRMTADELMLEQARNVSLRSTCIRARVGCVITNADKTQVLSIGYNGQARGLQNHCQSVFPGECGCLHAEINALIKAHGPVLYCTTLPCPNCATAIINAGVKEVYCSGGYRKTDSIKMFEAAKIKLEMRNRRSYFWKLSWYGV